MYKISNLFKLEVSLVGGLSFKEKMGQAKITDIKQAYIHTFLHSKNMNRIFRKNYIRDTLYENRA